MAQFAALGSGDSPDWYAIHGVHALVQYDAGIAYGGSIESESLPMPPDENIQASFDLVAEIFALDTFLLQYSGDKSQPLHIRRAQNLLRMEGLTDRWQGYVDHLATILRKTFAAIEDQVISELGWNPATLPDVSKAISNILQERLDAFHPLTRRRLSTARVAGRQRFDDEVESFVEDHQAYLRQLFVISVSELAGILTWPVEVLKRALADLALEPGSQPSFSLPTEDNLARYYSLISLGNDQYFAWLPGSLIQESHAWFYDLVQRRKLESLRQKYLAARDIATEELTVESLARVFGADRTLGNVRYSAEGLPDVDCVVSVPGDVLIVECKAHLLTGAGRRGAPGRLSTKFDELVVKPAKQASRFADHLRNGGSTFDSSGGRLSLPIGTQSVLPRMVVTYERVDPLATTSAMLAISQEGDKPEYAWAMPLADLMVIVDLIESPSTFWHYATNRWHQCHETELSAPSELEMLGLFFSNRKLFESLTKRLESEITIQVGPSSQAINEYYTSHAKARKKPVITMPTLVLEALDRMLRANGTQWTGVVATAMSEPDKTWTRMRSVLRKHSKARQPRRLKLVADNPNLALWIERDVEGSVLIDIDVSADRI
jgi:hypothetical protein